jgi:hypothetical protein
MSPERAGIVLPDALSFPRAAMRELVRGQYRVRKLRFELDAEGKGEILYQLIGGGRVFHFFLVSDLLPEQVKMDRNFAQGWDAMGVLCEGEWTAEREAYLRREVPRQRAGFSDYDTLMYARGNRSGRIFDHVVESLSQGRQPDLNVLAPVGYILRTTAFIGNGQLGTRPLAGYEPDHPLRRPYHAQFCSAFMLREYVFDLIDHLARVRSPGAVRLAPAYRRFLGLGNSAATGLAAYAANHAKQMQQWMRVHEEALVRAVQAAPVLRGDLLGRFHALLARAIQYFAEGAKPSDGVFAPPQETSAKLRRIAERAHFLSNTPSVLRDEKTISLTDLVSWARENVGGEAVEVLHAVIVELHPDVADSLVDAFMVEEEAELHPEVPAADLLDLLDRNFGWIARQDALARDNAYFWYRSTSAPRDVRRGVRGRMPNFEFESNLDITFKVRELAELLRGQPPDAPLAAVLAARPDLRHAASQVQSLCAAEDGVLREHWLSSQFKPFHAIRFVLAFYGMEKFEAAMPKSVRGTFMQGAPIAEDVEEGRDGPWPYPLMPRPDAPLFLEQLAPLPATAGKPTPVSVARGGDVPVLNIRRVSPGEVARMVLVALQGHGLPLGVAVEVAPLVAFEQATGAAAIEAALRHCRDAALAAVLPDPEFLSARGTRHLNGLGRSSLNSAALAADVAIEQALRSRTSEAAVDVANACDPWLVRSVVRRCARRGLLALLVWRDGASAGFSAAGPDDAGCWYAQGGLETPQAGSRVASAFEKLSTQSPGYRLLCLDAGGATSARQIQQLTGGGVPASMLEGAQLAATQFQWHRQGVALSLEDWTALAQAGAALLVPQSHEHLVLHEGADPLKTF